jgi:hypothetical protein
MSGVIQGRMSCIKFRIVSYIMSGLMSGIMSGVMSGVIFTNISPPTQN